MYARRAVHPAARRVERVLTAGAVHLKLYPTPRSFAERREVLRVLERFGEVVMFKSMKYDSNKSIPNAFFSLFANDASATDLIASSPIRYRLISTPSTPDPSDPLIPFSDPSDPEPSPAQEEDETLFELSATPTYFSPSLEVADPYQNPLYYPYKPIPTTRSPLAAALADHVPNSIWAGGLRDWETHSMRSRDKDLVFGEDVDGEEGRPRDGNAAFHFAGRERKRVQKGVPEVMRGLKALIEEREERDRANLAGSAGKETSLERIPATQEKTTSDRVT